MKHTNPITEVATPLNAGITVTVEDPKSVPVECDVKIKMVKIDPDSPEPKVGYNGTSAAFDLAAIAETTILPGEGKVVPVGYRFSIDEKDPYYMTIHLRSSKGFKHNIRPHIGIVDAGYTGDFGVKVYNHSSEPFTIEKHEYFAQVLVHKKPHFVFEELSEPEWREYAATQGRANGGFGSTGK